MRLEDLDFSKLRAFQLVATHGTLSAAATHLRLTIPAVSAKLRRLDDVLGVALFRRLPNGLVLTPAGERFLRDVTPLLLDAERVVASVQSQVPANTQETGSLSISIGGDYTSHFLPKINGFLNEFPKVQVQMRVSRSSDALAALQTGKLDFCLGIYPRLPTGVAAKVVARTTLALITKDTGAPQSQRPADLVSGRLIVAPRGTAMRQILRKSEFASDTMSYFECPTCQTAIDLVALGSGPAVVHNICVQRSGMRDLHVIDLGEKMGSLQLVVLFRRGARRSVAAQAFFEHVTT
ncbi:MAG: LysR family transcriptional regulator [Beijerinckiaceae bacterium]|jgi:DNA-binding transcriptional LysR family regulator|nr:LysR family transcriptional regulator [Beijerinckiaceae bacterium]